MKDLYCEFCGAQLDADTTGIVTITVAPSTEPVLTCVKCLMESMDQIITIAGAAGIDTRNSS